MKRPCINQWDRMIIRERPDSFLAVIYNLKISCKGLINEYGKLLNPHLNKIGLKVRGTK